MPTTTGATKKGRAVRRTPTVPKKPEPEVAVEVEEEELWADENSLPTGPPYKDVDLPVMEKKVRVRFLSNIEATQLALLPDLRSFAALMAKVQQLAGTGRIEDFTQAEDNTLREERMRYMTVVAHFSVMKKGSRVGRLQECIDCGLEHPPSMWTTTQVKYLHPNDLAVIANTAERGWELERVRPLSKEQTENPTSPPASTGESIQEPTS